MGEYADLYQSWDERRHENEEPACPNCAALESEVARLRTTISGETRDLTTACDEMQRERDAKAALLRELAAASGKAAEYLDFISRMASDLEWGQRQRALRVAEELREVLRRVDAEAGEEKK